MTFTPGDILLVPIVFTDGSGIKRRPVVVVCDYRDADVLVAPVTSQAERSSRDVKIQEWQKAGLRLPSICRMEKLATVDKSIVVKIMGKLSPADWQNAKSALEEFVKQILAY